MIRQSLEKDIDAINKLGSQLNSDFLATYNINNYIHNDKYIILVNEDDIINGLLIVFNNIDYYELEIIVVDENLRHIGIGQNMMNYFIIFILFGFIYLFIVIVYIIYIQYYIFYIIRLCCC